MYWAEDPLTSSSALADHVPLLPSILDWDNSIYCSSEAKPDCTYFSNSLRCSVVLSIVSRSPIDWVPCPPALTPAKGRNKMGPPFSKCMFGNPMYPNIPRNKSQLYLILIPTVLYATTLGEEVFSTSVLPATRFSSPSTIRHRTPPRVRRSCGYFLKH